MTKSSPTPRAGLTVAVEEGEERICPTLYNMLYSPGRMCPHHRVVTSAPQRDCSIAPPITLQWFYLTVDSFLQKYHRSAENLKDAAPFFASSSPPEWVDDASDYTSAYYAWTFLMRCDNGALRNAKKGNQ